MATSDYTSLDIYRDYVASGGELDEALFHSICEEFNERVMDEVIYKGREFNMGERLSTIEVVVADRNFNSPMVNWNESNKLKEELLSEGKELYSKDNPDGEKWFVYHTDDWYCKFHWNKSRCVVQNKSVYRFTPTRGKVGNKTKLKNFLREDQLAYIKYRKL